MTAPRSGSESRAQDSQPHVRLPPLSVHETLEPRALELLQLIAASPRPVGARELRRRLVNNDHVSESTVHRLLRRLDELGLTRAPDARGRVVSEAGRAFAARAHAEQHWNQQLGSLEIRTLGDVRDLLVARRGVEREAVRRAALCASDADIAALGRLLERPGSDGRLQPHDAGVSFHKTIASVVDNNVLRAVALVVFDPRFDTLEEVLDVVCASRGTMEESRHEHEAIVDALAARDPDAAERAMVRHLDRLLEEASATVAPSTRLAIELLLREKPTTVDPWG